MQICVSLHQVTQMMQCINTKINIFSCVSCKCLTEAHKKVCAVGLCSPFGRFITPGHIGSWFYLDPFTGDRSLRVQFELWGFKLKIYRNITHQWALTGGELDFKDRKEERRKMRDTGLSGQRSLQTVIESTSNTQTCMALLQLSAFIA